MDTSTTDLIKRFIDEALRQSPNNPQSNGYGLAMGTMAGLCIVLFAVIFLLYRDQKRERRRLESESKQARKDAAHQIDGQFNGLRSDINIGLDDMQKQVNAHIGNISKEHASFREELATMKVKMDFLQKGVK